MTPFCRQSLIMLLLLLLTTSSSQADIYRFVTIDGIETFTDAPMHKDAQVVVRSAKPPSVREVSRGRSRKPAPSLQEIVEKTVQAQMLPDQAPSDDTFETALPVTGAITSGVGMRIDPIDGQWRHHNGIDIAVPHGTPVLAIADGTVLYSGLRSGYGWTILLDHANGMITLYAHNSANLVETGQTLKKGATIALAGSTGRSTGPHVHFEAWQAGTNVTAAFMPGNSTRIAAIPRQNPAVRFRKEVLADGSLLITNLPLSTP